jgi:hypothetical protein
MEREVLLPPREARNTLKNFKEVNHEERRG